LKEYSIQETLSNDDLIRHIKVFILKTIKKIVKKLLVAIVSIVISMSNS